MDLGYGRNGTIVKFIVLEYIARVPYQAWERSTGWRRGSSRSATTTWQIGHDERVHKLDSLANMRAPRFHSAG